MAMSSLRVSALCCRSLNLPHSLTKITVRSMRTRQVGMGVRTGGSTLREKLLGPTSGKPFIYGTYAITGGSIVGLGALCFYGVGLGKGTSVADNAVLWPQYVRDRVHTTYGYLAGSLGITAAAGVAISRHPIMLRMASGGGLMMMFGSLAALIGTSVLCQSIAYSEHGNNGMKHATWLLHCGVVGAVLAPMCYLGGPAIVRAAWYTAGVVGGLSSIAMCAPSDKFLYMGAPLGMAFGVVFVSSIGTWFLPPTTVLGAGLMSIAVYGGLLVVSGLLLYDTQKAINKAEQYPRGVTPPFDPINAQIGLYMDIINIFVRIAMITGGNKKK